MSVFISVLILTVIVVACAVYIKKGRKIRKGKVPGNAFQSDTDYQIFQKRRTLPIVTIGKETKRLPDNKSNVDLNNGIEEASFYNPVEISAYNPSELSAYDYNPDLSIDNPERNCAPGINNNEGADTFDSNNTYNHSSIITTPERSVSPVKFINSGEINGYKYYSLITYYPENRYKKAPINIIKDRKTIYGFKDGLNWKSTADNIHNALVNAYTEKIKNWKESNVVFVNIPSSTRQKTMLRYGSFCKHISTRLGVSNGFGAITVKTDRPALKGQTGIDKTANLSYNNSLFENKYVLLFDDVKTSGESFVQNADKLKELGAKGIIGVFLGETYDTLRSGVPAWAINKVPAASTYDFESGSFDDLPF